jgi:hypothetical protein
MALKNAPTFSNSHLRDTVSVSTGISSSSLRAIVNASLLTNHLFKLVSGYG